MESESINQSINNSISDPERSNNNFLVILLSILLLISVAIAGFFAWQTQKLVSELQIMKDEVRIAPVATISPTAEPVATDSAAIDTSNWKTYPPATTVGLKYSFKYPSIAELTEAGDFAIFTTINSNISHRYVAKTTDIDALINNYQPFASPKIIFFSKSAFSINNLSGYKALTDGDTYYFLKTDNLNAVLVFSYKSTEKNTGLILDQILSTFKLTN